MTTDLRYEQHLGLALGGGGALGAAHVGVLQVLRERGIAPTSVAGTSAGALIGAAYAAGFDPYRLESLVRRARWGHFGAVTFRPGLGILDTVGLRATIDAIAGDDPRIEDLPTRFAAIATDLGTRRVVMLDRGSVIDALCASISVPGLFRPVRLDGRLLVDGGLLENLPLEAAFELGARHVIGVRLAPEWDMPGFESSAAIHALEIRDDVTLISPRLAGRSQWVAEDIPELVRLGRAAAEDALADYPVVTPPPAELPDADMPPAARLPARLLDIVDRRERAD